jgi:hypothetical protein
MSFWKRNQREQELEEEINSHLKMAAQDRIDRGESPGQAESAARRELGNAGLIREVTSEMWGWTWFEGLLQDLRYGVRMLRKSRCAHQRVACPTEMAGPRSPRPDA